MRQLAASSRGRGDFGSCVFMDVSYVRSYVPSMPVIHISTPSRPMHGTRPPLVCATRGRPQLLGSGASAPPPRGTRQRPSAYHKKSLFATEGFPQPREKNAPLWGAFFYSEIQRRRRHSGGLRPRRRDRRPAARGPLHGEELEPNALGHFPSECQVLRLEHLLSAED